MNESNCQLTWTFSLSVDIMLRFNDRLYNILKNQSILQNNLFF